MPTLSSIQSRSSTVRRPAVTSASSQRDLVALSLLLCGGTS